MEENRKQNHCSKRVQRGKQHIAIEKGNDSDGIPVENLPGHFYANLREIRKDVQCPICLEIIKKARTVMECLHSFCKECIEKAMRLGNNKCPACRTHCPSRRSLRDNPNLDVIIHFFFPDPEKFEEEEAAIDEEESRNKHTQELIAHVQDVQPDTFRKTHPTGRDASSSLTGGLTWGRGGARSRVRTTSLDFSNGRDDFNVQVSLSSLESTPGLQQWRLSCRSSFTVDYVRQHVVCQTSSRSEDVEILLARELIDLNVEPPDAGSNLWFQSLDGNKTLGEIIDYTGANSHNLDLRYKRK